MLRQLSKIGHLEVLNLPIGKQNILYLCFSTYEDGTSFLYVSYWKTLG